MFQLTLQLYGDGQWQDAMTLVFPEPEKGLRGPCRFGYKQDYLVENLLAIDRPFAASVSACVPLDWDARHTKEAPDLAFERLRHDALQLLALPDVLSASGLPDLTMNHPQIALKNLQQRLQEWGLK